MQFINPHVLWGGCLFNANNKKTTLNFYIGQRNATLSRRLTYRVLIVILQPKYNIRQIFVNYNEILFSTHCKKRFKILESIITKGTMNIK